MSADWRSPGLRSETLPTAPSGLSICHRPVTSGLPSAVRGAGAVRFGLPSAVRGMPGVGRCNHCASSGVTKAVQMITAVKIFIGLYTSRSHLLYAYGSIALRLGKHCHRFPDEACMNNGCERQPLFLRREILNDLLCDKTNDEMNRLSRMHSPAIRPVVRRQINRSSAVARKDGEIEEKLLCGFRRQQWI